MPLVHTGCEHIPPPHRGLLHYFLKVNTLDSLLIHPVAGFSFESFVIEELIRGIQTTMAVQVDFNYYRTVDKSEVDLILDTNHGPIPIEIKLNAVVKQTALRGLNNFISDMGAGYGIIVNRGKRVE